MKFDVSSMTAPLRTVALKKPGTSLLHANRDEWHYGPHFDPLRAIDNHAAFVRILQDRGVKILWMPDDDGGNADAVFTYDASPDDPVRGNFDVTPARPCVRGNRIYTASFTMPMTLP